MSVEQKLAEAASRADENPKCDGCGWEAPGGHEGPCPECGGDTWIDPLEVQKVAIRHGFQAAALQTGARDPDFDIWTVVDEATLRRGEPIHRNFERIQETFVDVCDSPELRERLVEIQEEMEAEAEEEDEA